MYFNLLQVSTSITNQQGVPEGRSLDPRVPASVSDSEAFVHPRTSKH